MNFAHPAHFGWFALFFILAAGAYLLRRFQKARIQEWFSTHAIEKVFPFSRWRSFSFWKGLCRVLALFFLVLAVTGPRIGQEMKTVKVSGSTVYILFDCSASMLAEDLKPNRLENSKILLGGLLEKMHGNRVGIIAFAGEPFVFCPLTFDLFAVRQFLRSIDPQMIPVPGTHIGSAIRLALSKMPETGSRAIVLLTDGEDHKSDPEGAVKEAESAGVRIFAIGIGKPEGEPIPIKDASGSVTGFKKNAKGEIVMSKLGEKFLLDAAQTTGGAYFRAEQSGEAIDMVSAKLDESANSPLTRKEDSYSDRYQWVLALSIFLFLLGETLDAFGQKILWRRTAVLYLLLAFGLSGKSYADSFRSKIAEGNKLYHVNKYEQALQEYEAAAAVRPDDPRASFNKGTAQYRLKAWDQSAEELQKSSMSRDPKMRARSLYNLGNVHLQSGKYAEAVKSYQESLRVNPRDEDAKENLKLALRFMKNPPPQNKDQKQQDKKGQDKSKEQKAQEGEKKENAKRMLKGASDEDQNKPKFKPKPNGKKKEDDEDW